MLTYKGIVYNKQKHFFSFNNEFRAAINTIDMLEKILIVHYFHDRVMSSENIFLLFSVVPNFLLKKGAISFGPYILVHLILCFHFVDITVN